MNPEQQLGQNPSFPKGDEPLGTRPTLAANRAGARPGSQDTQQTIAFIHAVHGTAIRAEAEAQKKGDEAIMFDVSSPPVPASPTPITKLTSFGPPSNVTFEPQPYPESSWKKMQRAGSRLRAQIPARFKWLRSQMPSWTDVAAFCLLALIVTIVYLAERFLSRVVFGVLAGIVLITVPIVRYYTDPENKRLRRERRINLKLSFGMMDGGRLATILCPSCERNLSIEIDRKTGDICCRKCHQVVRLPSSTWGTPFE